MDESRKAFEQWYLLNWGYREDNHETLFEIGPDDGLYYRLGVRLAYDAWQASREAIEIKLDDKVMVEDEFDKGHNCAIDYCADAIRSAGIKVKE
ncbi:hypothetical protein R7503_001429 [Escherichia coli]|nr:hypothetical protein [Escherichia coli]EJV2263032.1 hypothetical protein [Escherichia coli]ELQ8822239.1 hypothetical protein [Escherichia coli]ELT2213970.1 hypothetical protein [Escherichia coli]ELW2914351.1 hypothetical protein [Escherichia coli]